MVAAVFEVAAVPAGVVAGSWWLTVTSPQRQALWFSGFDSVKRISARYFAKLLLCRNQPF